MNDSPSQLALREMRVQFGKPVTWVILAGVAAVLAIAGPFETDEVMRFAPRLIYWAFLVTASYAFGFLVSELLHRPMQGLPPWARGVGTGLVTGLGVSVLVITVNFLALDFFPEPRHMLGFFAPILVISIIVSVVFDIIGQELTSSSNDETAANRPPPLLERLRHENRGALIWISVQDHYVDILTSKGREMVLLRLGDAMNEVGDVPGLQVHRSHWVALDHVVSAKRLGDRAEVTLSTGDQVPVSRTYVPAVRDAGFL